jgi:hypothetical protein
MKLYVIVIAEETNEFTYEIRLVKTKTRAQEVVKEIKTNYRLQTDTEWEQYGEDGIKNTEIGATVEIVGPIDVE